MTGVMGKLRFTTKAFQLDADGYRRYWEAIHKARDENSGRPVYWDANPGEDLVLARKAFLFVAAREKINLVVRRPRSRNQLELRFQKARSVKLDKSECCQRILDLLAANSQPMRRQDLVDQTGISGDQWALYINHLLRTEQVIKEGSRINTVYRLSTTEDLRN